MHCESCSASVRSALESTPGLQSLDINLSDELIAVTGTIAPSQVIKTMRSIGKDAIVRGAGNGDGGSAAVAILESHHLADIQKGASASPVLGLARIVSVGPRKTLFDLTLASPSGGAVTKALNRPGIYHAAIRNSGDISRGALSTGGIFKSLGSIQVSASEDDGGKTISGQSFVTRDLDISELIGRSVTVSTHETDVNDTSLVGVIARSAGVWQNDKTVCSCSGKTVWQERQDAIKRGVL